MKRVCVTSVIGLAAMAVIAACSSRIDVGPASVPSTADGGAGAAGDLDASGGADGGAADAPTPSLGDGAAPNPRWTWLNPLPQGNDLLGISGTSASDAWMVGAAGTILRWDGVKATPVDVGKPDQTYYAVHATAPDDVWIVGRSDAGQTDVLHWNGAIWSRGFTLADHVVHAIGGAGGRTWALVEPDANGTLIEEWTGTWTPVYSTPFATSARLRDVWALDGSNAWAVGDKGTIVHTDTDGLYPWGAPATSAAPGVTDPWIAGPFDVNINYVGVWGSAADDVWAMFYDAKQRTGFSHFDGTAWRVQQIWAHSGCWTDEITSRTGLLERHSHHLVGVSTNYIVGLGALSPARTATECGWVYDGQSWTSLYDLGSAGPLGLWAQGRDNFLGVSHYGRAFRLPEAAGAQFDVRDLFPGVRQSLSGLSVGTDGSAWAIREGDRGIVRWADGVGWQDVPVDGLSGPFQPTNLFALSEVAVWATGRVGQDVVALRWDGQRWTRSTIERGTVTAVWNGAAFPIWARSPSEVWVVGEADVWRWDGVTWGAVPWDSSYAWAAKSWERELQLHADADPCIWGSGPRDIWISAAPHILHFDGNAIRVVDKPFTTPFNVPVGGPIWGSGPNDVWFSGGPGLHWNGTTWDPIPAGGDYGIAGIWGTSATDVWLITGHTTSVSAPNVKGPFDVRHFDGHSLTSQALGPLFTSVAGSGPNDVWAVGEGGATARYWDPTHPPR